MPSRHLHHRRCSDSPKVTVHHGANADVCTGLVPTEGPVEHLRNALAVIRFALDSGAPVFGSADGPGVVVRVADLARLQARIEAAIGLLELDGAACCLSCGGTILQPTIRGVPRGSCHCKH